MTDKAAKILVIDDEESVRSSLVACLEDYEYEVLEGDNGQNGLDIFHGQSPDLILTDLNMPGMTGMQLLEKIREEDPETPIIVISGAGEIDDAIQALRYGAWDYITKPIADLEVLELAVNRALERKRLVLQNKMYAEKIEHNLQLLEEDQEAGRRVQMRLLPEETASAKGFDFRYKVMPSLYLSGDFVDFFEIDENKYGIYLADVSGHGASSAFITVLLKSLMSQYLALHRSSDHELIIRPELLMKELSKEIYDAKLGKYITMVYIVLDLQKHDISYVIGGHYPNPILHKADDSVQFLEGSGYPVGIIPDVDYEVHKLQLEPGDNLVLFSDGIMEVFLTNQNLDNKEQKLLEIVKLNGVNIEKILEECNVTKEKNEDQPDDITVMTINYPDKL